MPELKNVRHERFAQNIAKGMSGGPGYTAAGYEATGHSADVSASRLLRNVDTRTRIAELTAPALAETGATVERVLEELTCLAFYNVTQILESDDDGLTMKDPRTLPKDLRRSMISFKPIQVGEKTSYEYKFADKLRALEALARYLKMFNGTVVVENVFQVIQEMSDEELDRRLAELERALDEGAAPASAPRAGPKIVH